MQYLSKINWSGKFIFIILALRLLLGVYLQEDVSTGGATVDFYLFIWKFALALQENFFYTYNNWEEAHLPLHSIILAAIIEYICAQILECARDNICNLKRIRFKVSDIDYAIKNDKELYYLFNKCNIRFINGSIIPFIHPKLINGSTKSTITGK